MYYARNFVVDVNMFMVLDSSARGARLAKARLQRVMFLFAEM